MMIDRLNAIYGRVDTGVFVHVFDFGDNATHPWRVKENKLLLPSILDACVLNKRVPHMFVSFGIKPGLILSQAAVDRCTLCSWTHDAATDWRLCAGSNAERGCVPGCVNTHPPSFRKNMPQATSFKRTGIGPYAPNETSRMLRNRAHTNNTSPQGMHVDVVLSAPCYINMLPKSVDAFLVPCKLVKDGVFNYQKTFANSEYRSKSIIYYNDLVDPPFVAGCGARRRSFSALDATWGRGPI